MNQRTKRIVGVILLFAMLVSSLWTVGISISAATTTDLKAEGWFETITAEISGVTDSQVTGVSYSGTAGGSLTGEDLTYLVRDVNGRVRIDIPGLKAGTYKLTVETTKGTYTADGIEVLAYDRSGYAHFGNTEGVGAYNDDGTLKKDAIVIYVTNENKNTVSVTSKDGTTVKGIGNILGSTGMDVGNGLNSNGGKANTNGDILRKLAADGTPLVVRIIGSVKGASGINLSSATSEIDGLTAYNSIDYGGSKGDNGFMARMSGGKNITIEGVGYDATIDGWGLHFICQTADYKAGYGRNFEVRNITFRNVPEDCVGMEGQQESSTLTAPVERCWIHNCSFIASKFSSPAESDKDGGDGACDFKRGNYFTNSYCYYEGYHKTNLVGSSDSSLQYQITYHHNYWKNCESRGPLARQANIHMYNNIFEGQTSYCMNPRANAYIFSEYNMFLKCKNPVRVDSGAVKSYNDSFTSCTGDNNATIVTDKSTKVSTSNKYANFDTNPTLSYIPSGDYILQESITDMKAVVMAYAGVQKEHIVSAEDYDTSVIPSDRMPTAAVVLPYDKSLNNTYVTAKSGTFDNIVFNVSKTASDSVTVGSSASNADIVFYVDCTVNISMTEISSTYSPVLCNAAGEAFITGTGTASNLPAGYYFIQSGGYDVGSAKYKEAKVASLKIERAIICTDHKYSSDVTAPTCTKDGYTTYTCTVCGHSYKENGAAKNGHTPGAAATCTSAQTCTVCGVELAPVLEHNYVNGICSACGKVDQKNCTHSNVTSAKTAPTCTAAGYTTYTCTACGYAYTADNTAALGHNYVGGVCSACGANDLAANSYVHNFTENGKDSTFYTISGNLSTGKGTVSYNGLTLTQCLKIESSTNISFKADVAGTLTLVFVETSPNIKVDDTKVTGSDGIITVDVASGSHTITKADTMNLFYMVYTPNSTGGVHTHNYKTTVTAPTCTEDGYTTYACSCGDSYTGEKVEALGHINADGVCSTCKVALLLAKDESGNETYIENIYFEFLGASIRYADANGKTKPTNLVDIRFSYKFRDGVELTDWGWDYKLGTKVTGSREGSYKTDDNVTNLVFTNIAFINFEYEIQAQIRFKVEIDGKTYTVYGNYDSRTTLNVVKAYTALTNPAYADAKAYADEVYAAYQSFINGGSEGGNETPVAPAGSYVHNFTDDGWTSDFYTFAGDQITGGKHGKYTYDFGSGTETLNYALKLDSKGSVTFTPTADGTVTIAVASSLVDKGKTTVVINNGSKDVGKVTIDTANKLYVLTVTVSANTTYTIKRSENESGIYYVAYIPD